MQGLGAPQSHRPDERRTAARITIAGRSSPRWRPAGPPGPLRRLARSRRPRGGWFGAPRAPGRLAVGGRRARCHLPDLGRDRVARGAHPRRVPGGPPGRPLRRVPRCGLGGPPNGAPTRGRAGRDLERHALLLAALVPGPAHRLPPPRARRDVAHGAAADAWPGWATPSSAAWRRRFYRRSRIVTLSESSRARDRRHVGPPPGAGHRGPARRRRALHARRPPVADAAGGGRRPAGAGQALRRSAPRPGRGDGRSTRPRAVIIGEGYERPALEALRDGAGRGRVGQPARADVERRRARSLVSPGVGGGEQLAARGLGHDAHRGGGVRDARPWRRPSPATPTPSSTANRGSWSTTPTSCRCAWAGCSATTSCGADCPRAHWPGHAGSPGRRRPQGDGGAGRPGCSGS